MDRKGVAEKAAKLIRAGTVPPVLVCALLLIVYFFCPDVFAGPVQLALSLLFLVAVPLLAYPLAALLPLYRKQGREGQRNLAFLLNPLGYLAAVIYGCSADVSRSLLLIYLTYFLSVAVLLIFNKVLRQRASGHACGIAGPLILLIYFIGWMCVLPCAIIFAAVTWSSLYLHRHTLGELTAGSVTALLSFAMSLLLVSWLI